MDRRQVVSEVSERTGIYKQTVDDLIGAFLSVVSDAVAKGDRVTINGFGSFRLSDRSERTRRDFSTGELITVPAHKVPVFKASAGLRNRVHGV